MTDVKPPSDSAPRRIVILRALYLGDMLLAIPALRSLRAAFPQAELSLIGLPWAREFLERYHYIDRFLDFPGFPGMPEQAFEVASLRTFLQTARAYGYDLAIQMHGDGSVSNWFVAGLGAKKAVGYIRTSPQNPFLLNDSLLYRKGEQEIHKWLRLAHRVGADLDDRRLEFPLSAADTAELMVLAKDQRIFAGDRRTNPLIVVHVGAKHRSKLWPPERWAELVDALGPATSATIVLTGSENEEPAVLAVAHRASVPVLIAAGKTSLGGLAALLSRATLFVGADSGPAHLAEAVGTKTVRLFGPTDQGRWGPLDRERHMVVTVQANCAPCDFTDCPIDHHCLRGIPVDAVRTAALRLLHQPVAHS